MTKERALRIIRWRSAAAFAITFVNVGVAALFLATLAYIIVAIVVLIPDLMRWWNPPDNLSLDQSFSLALVPLYPLALVMVYVGIFILPIVLTLPLNAPIIGLWQQPPTFLLLRPFHRGVLSKPVKRVARRDIAPLGHTYTLSDADVHVPWYVRVPLVLGQLAIFSFRLKTVRDPGRLDAVDRAVRRTWLRNVNWCMSWNKLFAVASADTCWQPTVDLLLGRADAVFIDVTDLREHVVWEIQRAQGLGAATRTLYLIDASADMDQTTARLASLLPNQVDRAHVFAYDSHGLRERDRFRSLLVDTLTSADRPRPADRSMTMSVIATILFVITVIPLIILLRPLLDVPLGMPEQLRLAHWPEVVDPAAKATIALGLLTLLLLAIAARANGPIRFLLVVQILLLLGAAAGLLQF